MPEVPGLNNVPSTRTPTPSEYSDSTPRTGGGVPRSVPASYDAKEIGNKEVNSGGFPKSANGMPPGSMLMQLDPALIISMVTVVFNQLDEQQAASFEQQLKNAEPQYKKILDSRLNEIEKKFRKQLEVREQEKKAQIASDIQLGLGVALTVFGMIATILTAGALSGLMVAGMAIGAATTSLDLVNRGLKAGDVKIADPLDKSGKSQKLLDISIAGLVRMSIESAFANNAVIIPPWVNKKDKAAVDKFREELILGVTIYMTVMVAAGSIALSAGGIMQAKKLADAGKEAANAGKLLTRIAPKVADFAQTNLASIQMVNQSVDIAGDIANLGASVYQGASTITMANMTFDMRMAESTVNRLDSYADAARAYMELIQTTMRNSASSIGEIKKTLADTRAMLNTQLSETINAS